MEFSATMAPTDIARRVEDGFDATHEQAQRYVIRYQAAPVEISYMSGVSDEERRWAEETVLEAAREVWNEQHDGGD